MHLTWSLFASLNFFLIISGSITRPASLGLSQDIPNNAASSPQAPPVPITSPSQAPGNPDIAANTPTKTFIVIPLNPSRTTQVHVAINAFAIKDSIKTIKARNRSAYDYVLYWSFKATESAAENLEEALGSDVSNSVVIVLV